MSYSLPHICTVHGCAAAEALWDEEEIVKLHSVKHLCLGSICSMKASQDCAHLLAVRMEALELSTQPRDVVNEGPIKHGFQTITTRVCFPVTHASEA